MFYDTFGLNPYTVYVLTLVTAMVLFCLWLRSAKDLARVGLTLVAAIVVLGVAINMPSEDNPGSTEFWGMIGGASAALIIFIAYQAATLLRSGNSRA
jgi:hypothetical protein